MDHPVSSSSVPRGHHCLEFDCDLVEQIIAVEVDLAVRRLQKERNISIDPIVRRRWNGDLRQAVVHTAMEQATEHTFLPVQFQECLQRTLQDMVNIRYPFPEPAEPACSQVIPSFSLFTRLLVFCHHFHHKKPHSDS